MNGTGKWLVVGLAVLLLCGCASLPTGNVKPTPLLVAQSEVPEDQLLDVGIKIFAPGRVTNEQVREEGQSSDVRKAEAVFVPFHLKNTLQTSGNWGAVWVVPGQSDAVDVNVTGEILSSSGEQLVMKVAVRDATGRLWVEKKYALAATQAVYNTPRKGEADPYQNAYNAVANDLLAIKRELTSEQLREIRRVSQLRFAGDLAPEAFAGYLESGEEGTVRIDRLPARDDPMMNRLLKVREREYMLYDTVNEHYAGLYDEMWDPYLNWRRAQLTEIQAYRELKRQETMRKLLSVAAIAGAIAYDVSGGGGRSRYYSPTVRNLAIVGGIAAWQSGAAKGQEAEIHAEALRELGISFEEEIQPQVVELEGRTLKLTGTAEQQYAKWRRLLREIYVEETGIRPVAVPQSPVAMESEPL